MSSQDYKFRELHGRAFNSQSENYMLPADDTEHTRLDMQHDTLRLHLNGLYPAADQVKAALSPEKSERPAVLDIGTGSGRWALDMAVEFPHAQIVGLDLAPPTISLKGPEAIPQNCRFEVVDVNHPLVQYEGKFDVVHVRGVELGVHDYELFLYNVARTLKPGGLLILIGGYAQLFDENLEPMPVTTEGQPGFTWAQRLFGETYGAFVARADNAIDSKQFWPKWTSENPNYENPTFQDEYIPIGPWESGLDERRRYVSELMLENMIVMMHAYKPLLLQDGAPSDVVDQMLENAIKEVRELKTRGYVKWLYVWMSRTSAPWTGRSKTPQPLEPEPSVYFTEEYKREKAMSPTQRSATVVTQSGSSAPSSSYVS
ncbi:hypothetical protein FRC03_007009 [Tulasnella sp. 419]|nr:hypothetical protein FRC03_007009 [Tulasnella sp. 419]